MAQVSLCEVCVCVDCIPGFKPRYQISLKVWLWFGATWWYPCAQGLVFAGRVKGGSPLPFNLYELMNSWSFTLYRVRLFTVSTQRFMKPETMSLFTGVAQSQTPSRCSIKYLLNEWVNQKTSWTRTECQEFLYFIWRLTNNEI